MSTVGYGDIVPRSTLETAFATLAVLFGGLIVPAMVGGLAACISSLHQVWPTGLHDRPLAII